MKAAAVWALAAIMLTAGAADARNKPCSGKKGGVVGCRGDKFLCKNGTLSASKRACTRDEANAEQDDDDGEFRSIMEEPETKAADDKAK